MSSKPVYLGCLLILWTLATVQVSQELVSHCTFSIFCTFFLVKFQWTSSNGNIETTIESGRDKAVRHITASFWYLIFEREKKEIIFIRWNDTFNGLSNSIECEHWFDFGKRSHLIEQKIGKKRTKIDSFSSFKLQHIVIHIKWQK